MDKLVFVRYKLPEAKVNEQGVIKITPEAARAIEDACRETGFSMRNVASQMILFAAEHYEVKEY